MALGEGLGTSRTDRVRRQVRGPGPRSWPGTPSRGMALGDGIFMTPGREEEWTLKVAHDEAAVDRYSEVFAELAGELAA